MRYSDETKRKAIELREEGATFAEISKQFGAHKDTIRLWVNEKGRVRKNRLRSRRLRLRRQNDPDFVEKMREQGRAFYNNLSSSQKEEYCRKTTERYYNLTPDQRSIRRERYRELRRENPEKYKKMKQKLYRRRNLEQRIKRSLDEILRNSIRRDHLPCLSLLQDIKVAFTGKCHICGVGEEELKRNLSLDHDHDTGAFRGWLCGKCNMGIGLINDNLVSAQKYLGNRESDEYNG
jgi:transposase-like protein